MSLVRCERCGFVRVEWGPCECCANDFGLGEVMADVGLDHPAGNVDSFHHKLILLDSHLTEPPTGGYVHSGQFQCANCGERFYLLTIDRTHQVADAAHMGRQIGRDFRAMVESSRCMGVTQ